ncbi:hypothetical protein [Pengzhenrongella sicca]|nr:hypothetical protein [Pengzhenrongella sicca]
MTRCTCLYVSQDDSLVLVVRDPDCPASAIHAATDLAVQKATD